MKDRRKHSDKAEKYSSEQQTCVIVSITFIVRVYNLSSYNIHIISRQTGRQDKGLQNFIKVFKSFVKLCVQHYFSDTNAFHSAVPGM